MTAPTLALASLLGDVGALVARSGVFAKFIILILFAMSVISWAVMAQRARALTRIRRQHDEFWDRFDGARRGESGMEELDQWCQQNASAPLASVFGYFSSEYWPMYRRRRGDGEDPRLLFGILQRGVDRAVSAAVGRLERGLGWLATLSSVAPFLGLLGTVWGIMHSFLQLGRQGSATLDVVGPGIAEALITTVCGLAVAIPSVVGYNFFARRLQDQETEMRRLGSLLADVVTEEEFGRGQPAVLEEL